MRALRAAPPSGPTLSFEKLNYYVGEGGGSITLKVILSEVCAGPVTVQYTTLDASAHAPGDFVYASNTLVFAPGETDKPITITIQDDAIPEPFETFSVVLTNATGGATISSGYAVVTIIDDDGPLPTVEFDAPSYTITEDGASVTIQVSLSALAPVPVTVDYTTKDGPAPNGAVAGSDYTALVGTLTFLVGQKTNTLVIPILDDSVPEIDETFNVELSKPSAGVNLGTQTVTSVTILDNDVPPWTLVISSDKVAICAGAQLTPTHQTTITATIVDGYGIAIPIAGVSINFSTTAGTVGPAVVVTDFTGTATTTLTSGNYASEGAVLFNASVTAQSGASSVSTDVEFQPPVLTVSASPTGLTVGTGSILTANDVWNTLPADVHLLGWSVTQVWELDDTLVYDGSGPAPTGYGTFAADTSVTSTFGYAEGYFLISANCKIELLCADLSVSYMASGDNPKAKATITGTGAKDGDLVDIYNSQNPTEKVSDDKETTVGAFTVVNFNDTNGDVTVDLNQDDVKATKLGRDEIDLMKMVIPKQTPVAGKKIKVSLVSGVGIRFWKEITKGGKLQEIAVNKTDPKVWWFEFNPADFPGPRAIWLEAINYSSSVRDTEIKVEYNSVSQSVRATAVWATMTAVEFGTKSDVNLFKEVAWKDMPTPPRDQVELYGGTGLRTPDAKNGVRNLIAIQFTIYPKDVWKEKNVKFDISRIAQLVAWQKNGKVVKKIEDEPPFSKLNEEEANDDEPSPGEADESAEPDANGLMFVIDAPGTANLVAAADLLVFRFNAREFVRVRFDGMNHTGDGVSGSRCSLYYDWHTSHYLVKDANGKYGRSKDGENDIGEGHIEIGTFP